MNDERSSRIKGHYATGEPSVTTILNVVSKPALTRWLQKETFNATLDGAKTFAQADAVVRQISQKAMGIGTRVHKYVEQYGQKMVPEKYDDLMLYYKAFHDWIVEYNPVFLESETTVTSKKFGYKGTLDIIAKIGEKVCLVDLKTGKGVYDSVELQTSAYKQAYEEETTKKIDETWVLLLEKGDDSLPTGNFQFEQMEYVPEIFNAAVKIYNWKKSFKK